MHQIYTAQHFSAERCWTLIKEKTLTDYKHREGYTGNKKGSYIDKGKTKWDYSSGDAKPGNERIVTQINNKMKKDFGVTANREEVKRFLKYEETQDLYNKLKKSANKKFGNDENNPRWRGYVYGIFTKVMARRIAGKD